MTSGQHKSEETILFESLKPGDVCAALSTKTRYMHRTLVHVVTLREPASTGVRGWWLGDAWCGVTNRTDRYVYWWSVMPDVSILQDDDPHEGVAKCRKCWALVKPETIIRGWTEEVQVAQRALPFGWHEVAIGSHPWDVAEDGDPDLVQDGTGEVKGVRRGELRRWQRGHCIVRMLRNYETERFEVRAHLDTRLLQEAEAYAGSETKCVDKAWDVMASGGRV